MTVWFSGMTVSSFHKIVSGMSSREARNPNTVWFFSTRCPTKVWNQRKPSVRNQHWGTIELQFNSRVSLAHVLNLFRKEEESAKKIKFASVIHYDVGTIWPNVDETIYYTWTAWEWKQNISKKKILIHSQKNTHQDHQEWSIHTTNGVPCPHLRCCLAHTKDTNCNLSEGAQLETKSGEAS